MPDLPKFLDLEIATYSGTDYLGTTKCAVRVRLTFTRNLIQYADPKLRDYDTIWVYDVPCSKTGFDFTTDIAHEQLRSVVLIDIWQARIAAQPVFWNWNESATVIGGPAAELNPGWWTNWEKNDKKDVIHAASMANDMISDLSSSPEPWLEFKNNGPYKDATVIY